MNINLTREEWLAIVKELNMLHHIPCFPENDHDLMLINIIDRIEKNIGVE